MAALYDCQDNTDDQEESDPFKPRVWGRSKLWSYLGDWTIWMVFCHQYAYCQAFVQTLYGNKAYTTTSDGTHECELSHSSINQRWGWISEFHIGRMVDLRTQRKRLEDRFDGLSWRVLLESVSSMQCFSGLRRQCGLGRPQLPWGLNMPSVELPSARDQASGSASGAIRFGDFIDVATWCNPSTCQSSAVISTCRQPCHWMC